MLRLKARANKLAIPASDFHDEESERSARCGEFVWQIVKQLGGELCFRSSADISNAQLLAVALDFCGLPSTNSPTWQIAFTRDPNQPIIVPDVLVHFSHTEDYIHYFRQAKSMVGNVYSAFKASRRGKSQSYRQELEFMQTQLIRETFMPRFNLSLNPPLDDLFNYLGENAQREFTVALTRVLKHSKEPLNFFKSTQLREYPFLYINASLMAADIFFYPQTSPSASLSTDFFIVASVLPYVDILATDGHISQLIKRAGLGHRYQAKVFSMKGRHALMNEIANL